MAEQKKAEEEDLSIQEILSSIRQIIAEDDEDEAAEEQAAQTDDATKEDIDNTEGDDMADEKDKKKQSQDDIDNMFEEAGAEDSAQEEAAESDAAQDDDSILELDDPIEEAPKKQDEPIELDMTDLEDKEGEGDKEPEKEEDLGDLDDLNLDDVVLNDKDDLISSEAATASMAALSKLGRHTPINSEENREGGVSLEDLTKELLRPMLKDWLDENLPTVIEGLVQKELRRLTSRSLDD